MTIPRAPSIPSKKVLCFFFRRLSTFLAGIWSPIPIFVSQNLKLLVLFGDETATLLQSFGAQHWVFSRGHRGNMTHSLMQNSIPAIEALDVNTFLGDKSDQALGGAGWLRVVVWEMTRTKPLKTPSWEGVRRSRSTGKVTLKKKKKQTKKESKQKTCSLLVAFLAMPFLSLLFNRC